MCEITNQEAGRALTSGVNRPEGVSVRARLGQVRSLSAQAQVPQAQAQAQVQVQVPQARWGRVLSVCRH